MKKIIFTFLSLTLMAGCAHAPKVENPERPRISATYQKMLMVAGPETAKAALEHEWDWHGYADKMENRVK